MKLLSEFLHTVSNHLLMDDVDETHRTPGIIEEIETAREEWISACEYFEHVIDADLVDHAIFTMGAAERKYMYLLREARKAGVQVDRYGFGNMVRARRV